MKKTSLLSVMLIALALLFVGCKQPEDETKNETQTQPIEDVSWVKGTWEVKVMNKDISVDTEDEFTKNFMKQAYEKDNENPPTTKNIATDEEAKEFVKEINDYIDLGKMGTITKDNVSMNFSVTYNSKDKIIESVKYKVVNEDFTIYYTEETTYTKQ